MQREEGRREVFMFSSLLAAAAIAHSITVNRSLGPSFSPSGAEFIHRLASASAAAATTQLVIDRASARARAELSRFKLSPRQFGNFLPLYKLYFLIKFYIGFVDVFVVALCKFTVHVFSVCVCTVVTLKSTKQDTLV
jgi:hypothetical protein